MPSDIAVTRRSPMLALRTVTDAVVAELTAGWTTLAAPASFTATPQRIYDTELQLEADQIGSLDAVMGDVKVELLDRVLRQYDCRVDVVARQIIDPSNQAAIDALSDFAGRVHDYITPSDYHPLDASPELYYRPLSTLQDAVYVESKVLAPYVPELLRGNNQFESIILVTYRIYG